ncbi:hypothetical protein [Anaerococcus hydrogenalis]|uniref:Conserved domain protein n=1 Tax=Anaerococcus hydrogenalis ACS-025-V-Sch4 TaxID=879306 RepID=F0H246_9FIRM|nr:hypothetical protein [Anaerococcus hydrogenalis]EGC83496.1 conserved domain protein [Anaerococcus hydrogenalis ACS-025-V-Sch4]
MLKDKKYYNLVKKQLDKDKILEKFEKNNGKITSVMEIDVVKVPENVNIDQKEDHDEGIYAFGVSFSNINQNAGVLLDIKEFKPLSPFWIFNQEKSQKDISQNDLKFFMETLVENIEDGNTNFPIFVFYNSKNKLSISPQAIDPLDILKK